jgi:hypothetical protein
LQKELAIATQQLIAVKKVGARIVIKDLKEVSDQV